MPRVILYTRPGCRLCDHAKTELLAAVPKIEVEEIDVDSDSDLQNRYGYHVPVAVADGQELFRHRFDPGRVRLLRDI